MITWCLPYWIIVVDVIWRQIIIECQVNIYDSYCYSFVIAEEIKEGLVFSLQFLYWNTCVWWRDWHWRRKWEKYIYKGCLPWRKVSRRPIEDLAMSWKVRWTYKPCYSLWLVVFQKLMLQTMCSYLASSHSEHQTCGIFFHRRHQSRFCGWEFEWTPKQWMLMG